MIQRLMVLAVVPTLVGGCSGHGHEGCEIETEDLEELAAAVQQADVVRTDRALSRIGRSRVTINTDRLAIQVACDGRIVAHVPVAPELAAEL